MKFSGIEYLCIDIANCYGLDKELFQDRIQWVKDNFHNLEELADDPDIEDKYLYIKSVQALRDVIAGKPTGHLISLDSTCSGLQILSALTCDPAGARITNLTGENKRFDAYTEITNEQNTVIEHYGFSGNTVSRKDSKQAVMTSLYGSEKTPKDIFGEEGPLLEAFYEACYQQAPGAFNLLSVMKQAWQPGALSHYWKLPDGEEWGWQAKYFLSTPNDNQWKQIDKSVKKALDKDLAQPVLGRIFSHLYLFDYHPLFAF